MDLHVEDLYRKHDQLAAQKLQTYERICKQCANTIKFAANAGELFCVFEIPSYVFNSEYPFINVPSCADYIIAELAKVSNKMRVKFVEPNALFIDWRRFE